MIDNIYSWQSKQWAQMSAYKKNNALPHAIMLLGQEGLGKKTFALNYAKFLLCSNENMEPCGNCHSCHLLNAQTHPDLLLVEPEKAGGIIKVDQVRDLIQFANETAMQGSFRIIIINPANNMNVNAANALLKTLEEPAPKTLLILISDRNFRLPATIMSRCQKITFQKPEKSTGIQWLQAQASKPENDLKFLLHLADGAPLKALELLQNNVLELRQDLYQGLSMLMQNTASPMQLAERFHESDLLMVLNLWIVWLQDILKLQLIADQTEIVNVDYQKQFTMLTQKVKQQHLLKFIDYITEHYGYLLRSLNLNRQLMLEELFIRWNQYAVS